MFSINFAKFLYNFDQQILPRDAMRKRSLCYGPVSVCPSVCHVRVLYPDG